MRYTLTKKYHISEVDKDLHSLALSNVEGEDISVGDTLVIVEGDCRR
jgi:hypothetical protein